MSRFRNGLRVLVRATGFNDVRVDPPVAGTVVRLRMADDGAWVQLDERAPHVAYPFPADDSRATHVRAFPDGCEALS